MYGYTLHCWAMQYRGCSNGCMYFQNTIFDVSRTTSFPRSWWNFGKISYNWSLKNLFFYIIHKNLLLTGHNHNLGEGCEQQGPAMITNGIIAHLRRLGKTEQIILHYKHQCFSCKTVRSFHVFSSIFHLFLYVLMPR